MFRKRAFHGGVHPPENKGTSTSPVSRVEGVTKVRIPMKMHSGPVCTPVVKRGEEVTRGQVIGEATGIAVPIHASVSGKVKSVKNELMGTGFTADIIEIESDGENTLSDTCVVPSYHDRESFLDAVRASGMVGLGGAGFPTWQKFNPTGGADLDILIVNGMECEPYITSDHRQMVEDPENIVDGIVRLIDSIGFKQVILGIEDNKPDAIEALSQAVAARGSEASKIEVRGFETRFPQGAARVLVHSAIGKAVPAGGRTTDTGAQVINVATVNQLEKYFKTGIPLIDKIITIAGDAIAQPGNYLVPIGTSIEEAIALTGGFAQDPAKILMGGPMNGFPVGTVDTPIIKNNNALVCFSEKAVANDPEMACIRCGRCVRGCPMNLMPLYLDAGGRSGNFEMLDRYSINTCIECGTCSYVCPSKRHLVQGILTGKSVYRTESAKLKLAAAEKAGVPNA